MWRLGSQCRPQVATGMNCGSITPAASQAGLIAAGALHQLPHRVLHECTALRPPSGAHAARQARNRRAWVLAQLTGAQAAGDAVVAVPLHHWVAEHILGPGARTRGPGGRGSGTCGE